MVFMSTTMRGGIQRVDLAEAARKSAEGWRTNASFRQEWEAFVKNIRNGQYLPLVTRGVMFRDNGLSGVRLLVNCTAKCAPLGLYSVLTPNPLLGYCGHSGDAAALVGSKELLATSRATHPWPCTWWADLT